MAKKHYLEGLPTKTVVQVDGVDERVRTMSVTVGDAISHAVLRERVSRGWTEEKLLYEALLAFLQ